MKGKYASNCVNVVAEQINLHRIQIEQVDVLKRRSNDKSLKRIPSVGSNKQQSLLKNHTKQSLDNLLAETSPMNVSVDYNAKMRKKSQNCQLANRDVNHHKDQKQQLMTQNYLSKHRKHSHSFSKNKKKIDHYLFQNLREKLQHHPSLFGNLKTKMLINYEEEGDCENSFQNKAVNSGKLVLWTEGKLTKMIEGFYAFVFKNENQHKQTKKNIKKITHQNEINALTRKYLFEKFKTQKLCRQNFINLSYSLYCHLNRVIKSVSSNCDQREKLLSKMRYYQIFDRILTLHYDYEDVIFYLCSRHLLNYVFDQQHEINVFEHQKQLSQFLNLLTKKDQNLVQRYKKYLKQLFESGECIEKESLLYFLLDDFKKRKEQINVKTHLLQNNQHSAYSFSKKHQAQLSPRKGSFDNNFWQPQVTPHIIDPQLYLELKSKLLYQCQRLISILCPNISSQCKLFIEEILMTKSLRMLHTIAEMSKRKWFQQLRYSIHSTKIADQAKDLEQVDELQRYFHEIVVGYRTYQISQLEMSEFLRKLLTPRAFVNKLQILIQDLENNQTY